MLDYCPYNVFHIYFDCMSQMLLKEIITDLNVIFSPVGDALFRLLSNGTIQAFPSLPASVS